MIRLMTPMRAVGCLALTLVLAACTPNLSDIQPADQSSTFLTPYPSPRPGRSLQRVSLDGGTTYVETAPSIYEKSNPFDDPPGSNFINNVESNMYDGRGREMPNTLPSTRKNPYNLHDGEVKISKIDKRSPTTDIDSIIRRTRKAAKQGRIDRKSFKEAVDIIEGNRVFPNRKYNGFPLLHYNGPNKVQRVKPIYDANGKKIGGNVNIHQIWYDSHIESDTSFIDPIDVFDVPWTITYTVDVLERGEDDFAPAVMYFDDPYLSPPGGKPKPNVGMDQTFFPMEIGTRSIIKLKMSLGKYYNLTYTWGWRVHPPRVQVSENARKTVNGRTLPDWERLVFGNTPTKDRKSQLAAIAKIGDLSPAKRMWKAMLAAGKSNSAKEVLALLDETEAAFHNWKDRTKLPRGVTVNKDTDLTLFYINNTIYGAMPGGATGRFERWKTRGTQLKVSLINGDHFVHSYISADFGGSRGFENQYQSTVNMKGSGPWFTFGRFGWWMSAGGPWGLINVPPAEGSKLGRHEVVLNLNYEPTRRLRIYQFDPLHHDVAIFSIH